MKRKEIDEEKFPKYNKIVIESIEEEEEKEKEYVQLEFDFDIAKEDNVAPI